VSKADEALNQRPAVLNRGSQGVLKLDLGDEVGLNEQRAGFGLHRTLSQLYNKTGYFPHAFLSRRTLP
jgi:hypothetical protein